MLRRAYFTLVILALLSVSCSGGKDFAQPPLPGGYLINKVPESADIIFSSIRYVLHDPACLDKNNRLIKNFLLDGDCGRLIYDPDLEAIASPSQLFTLNLASGEVVQLTNIPCHIISGQVVDSVTLMANAVCSESGSTGFQAETERSDLYLLHLNTSELDCLTCGSGLAAINNPDYSRANEKIVFSARKGGAENNNFLYAVDQNKNLERLTGDGGFMDFDCAWSADGEKIVFNRLPAPWFTIPSQAWMMNADGTVMEKITDGGTNPSGEEPKGVFQIGLDVDPDFSPDNSQIVFSRLISGKKNEPFGVFALIMIDLQSKEEQVLDDTFANMVPVYGSKGILFIRQTGSIDVVDRHQGIVLFHNGEFIEIENDPYNIFPMGAISVSWVELDQEF